ncbi:MAG: hypothetical protein HY332_09095 [Chloroflexi bacterium]|nr:hypothetical protein [Chloroflexota bacterium]
MRRTVSAVFKLEGIGLALVDFWNFGWEDGPIAPALGPEFSLGRGVSHAQRKRWITDYRIAPAVDALRSAGVQVFHCTHADILQRYSQWQASTPPNEREALEGRRRDGPADGSAEPAAPNGGTPR